MYGLPIEKRAVTAKVPLERLATVLQTPKHFPQDLREYPQTPKHFPRDLRNSRKHQKVSRETCGTPANAKAFPARLAELPQTPKSFPRHLRNSRKRQSISRETCGTPANTKKFSEALAELPQTPKSFSRHLRDSRKRQSISRETCGTPANTKKFSEVLAGLPQRPRQKESVRRVLFPVHAPCYASTFLWMDGAGYLAIFSSHFNMPSMTNMEMRQMVRKTVQHCQMGILLYISGPIQRKRLPMAVAPSQRP